MAVDASCRDRLILAAYLGEPSSRAALGADVPEVFSLGSMVRGGDRRWRAVMRQLGHGPAAEAACAVAELALSAYLAAPDSGSEVAGLARAAVAALGRWREGADPAQALAVVREDGLGFALAVDVGGRLSRVTGERGRQLGRVVGKCVSVILAPANPRYVRWLGEAADGAHAGLGVAEDVICRAVARALLRDVRQSAPDPSESA